MERNLQSPKQDKAHSGDQREAQSSHSIKQTYLKKFGFVCAIR
jgi:hypothetical protein